MRKGKTTNNSDSAIVSVPDAEILTLFERDPEQAWRLFIERYADVIYSCLHYMGFDHDQAMDRFVYVCEKLCEQDFRRLRTIRYAGRSGELTPWVRKVVKHLSINWAWSVEGRRRLLRSISRLPASEQRIFELYFWKGLSPSAIHEHLRLEYHHMPFIDVLDALERIFSQLSRKKLWRLMSNLPRIRAEVALDGIDAEVGTSIEIADERVNPEEELIRKEADERMSHALDCLLARERLVVQFRYEEGMAVKDVAEMLRLGEKEVKNLLKAALSKLRQTLK